MIRKAPKKMKKKKKTKASNEYEDPYSHSSTPFPGNTNTTHSKYCVTKSWRLPPRQCTTASSRHPTLVEINIGNYTRPPPYLDLPYKTKATTPYKTGCEEVSLAVTGDCTPAFEINIRKMPVWSWTCTSQNCDIKELYGPSQKMRFCQVVELDGIFYVMSLQGSVVVIEIDSDHFGITRIGGNRAAPSKACRQFREYLVKSDGEILVVFLIWRKSIDVVDDAEVFRLDTEKLLWVQVGNIGDRAFFLEEEGCVKFGACERGFKKNCIYFTHNWLDNWFVFDMETRLILPHLDVEIETLE